MLKHSRFLVVAVVVGAACAGFFAVTGAASARSPAIAPLAYKVVPINQGDGPANLQKALDANGAQGWQLVAVDGALGILIFRK